MRRTAVPVVAVLLGALLALGSAYAGDRLTTQPNEIVAPATDKPVAIGPASSADPSAPAPGSLVDSAPMRRSVPTDDVGWMLPADIVIPPAGQEPLAPLGRTGGDGGTPPPVPFIPVADAGSTAESLGLADLDALPTIAQFVDNCAAGGTPCPPGTGGTIKPGIPMGPLPEPSSPHLHIWPDMTKTTQGGLRCDPGFRTSQRLPVVVTADSPLDWIEIKLSIKGLDELYTWSQTGSGTEQSWYDGRVAANQPVDTAIDHGLQFCASMRTEGDSINALKLTGKALPSPLVYRIDVRARRRVKNDVEQLSAWVETPASTPAGRPPVRLEPQTGHVVQLTIPELDSASALRPKVWARMYGYAAGDVLPEASNVCSAAPASYATQIGVLGAQHALPSDQLASPDYAYDRAYSHSSTTNMVFVEGSMNLLCVQWANPSTVESQGYWVQVPDGLRFRLYLNSYENKNPGHDQWLLSAPAAGCWRWRVDKAEPGPHGLLRGGTGDWSCDSQGLPFPYFTTFVAERFHPDDGSYVEMGRQQMNTLTWCDSSPQDANYGIATLIDFLILLQGPCGPRQWHVDISWWDPTVCGGGLGSDCDQYRHATVHATAELYEGLSNGHRSQSDWNITVSAPVKASAPSP